MSDAPSELQTIYGKRFAGCQDYRKRVWQVLIRHFFSRYIPPRAAILDLGCGYGEFINQVPASAKYGMDLNPATERLLSPEVCFLRQDCAAPWRMQDNFLDVVFTSNFFEHLPNKTMLSDTLAQVRRCLKPGGSLIAMGPNIKFVPGAYWDFWDHYLPLTELSLSEGLRLLGFQITLCRARFLPYTMVNAPRYPLLFLRLYLALPIAWQFLGRQFLVIACKPAGSP